MLTVVWVLATELVMGNGRSPASLAMSITAYVFKSCLKPGAIVELSVVLVGSSSMLLSNTSSGLGLTPLTFCPLTGRISTNLLADVLLIALNPGLATFSRLVPFLQDFNESGQPAATLPYDLCRWSIQVVVTSTDCCCVKVT